jgi:hypothetical protein
LTGPCRAPSVDTRSNPSRPLAWLPPLPSSTNKRVEADAGAVHKLVDGVTPMLGYACRLAHRMQRMAWKASDPLYVAAWDAYHALHALCVNARYASCLPGTAGKPSEG